MAEEIEIIQNKDNQRFEVRQGDHLAELVYRIRDNTMYMMHTGVPEEMGNQGIAKALTEHALRYALSNGHQIVAYCPYVRAYMKHNLDWRKNLSPSGK